MYRKLPDNDFFQNVREDNRNQQLTKSIYTLANVQNESNEILKQQLEVLQKRNAILEQELRDSQKETKKAMVFNIIASSIAFASFIATILIGIFSVKG